MMPDPSQSQPRAESEETTPVPLLDSQSFHITIDAEPRLGSIATVHDATREWLNNEVIPVLAAGCAGTSQPERSVTLSVTGLNTFPQTQSQLYGALVEVAEELLTFKRCGHDYSTERGNLVVRLAGSIQTT